MCRFDDNTDESEAPLEPLAEPGDSVIRASLDEDRPGFRAARQYSTSSETGSHDAKAGASVSRSRMSRTMVNFWLDAALAVIFACLCITAVIVQFVFPVGVAARGWSLWGLSYGAWSSLQFGLIALLGLGVLVHVMLHWPWVCSVFAKRVLGRSRVPDDGIRTVYGVSLLITLLMLGAVAVGAAQWMIISPR